MTIAFLESQFPVSISQKSKGGPSYSTVVSGGGSGFESRRARWNGPRYSWDAATGIKGITSLELVTNFFHAVKGRAGGWRWQDIMDYKSCPLLDTPAFDDVIIGVADSVETDFQLIKKYTYGAAYTDRTITKPVTGTVLIGVNGTPQGSGWTVDTTTGIISFSVAPTTGNITAGFLFDIPARFLSDTLSTDMESYNLGQAHVPVIEIRV